MTCGLKTLGDAVDLRDRIFGAFEEAERAADPAARDEWLTFVVVGGGPTGVEISGQLAILAAPHDEARLQADRPGAARVILLDAGERVVAAFSETTSAKAAEELGELGVTVREHARVTDIDARGVTVKLGDKTERIATRTVVWAAGVRAAGIAEILARATGASTDRAGHVEVNPDLTVPGHPEISVIGDAAKSRARTASRCPARDGRDPAGPPRGRRDPRRPARRLQALQVLRQRRARRRRPRQGGVRSQGSPASRACPPS